MTARQMPSIDEMCPCCGRPECFENYQPSQSLIEWMADIRRRDAERSTVKRKAA